MPFEPREKADRITFVQDRGPEMPWECPDCQHQNSYTPPVVMKGWAASWSSSKEGEVKEPVKMEQRDVWWVECPPRLSCGGCEVEWVYVGIQKEMGQQPYSYYERAISRVELLQLEEG